MKKHLIAIALLLSTKSIFAAQCPSADDFTHAPGQDWQLSEKAKADGWNYSVHGNRQSSATKIPDNNPMLVILSLYKQSAVTQCNYGNEFGIVSAPKNKIPNFSSFSSSFSCVTKTSCLCHETVKNLDSCAWKWY